MSLILTLADLSFLSRHNGTIETVHDAIKIIMDGLKSQGFSRLDVRRNYIALLNKAVAEGYIQTYNAEFVFFNNY